MKNIRNEPIVLMLLILTLISTLEFVTIMLYKNKLEKVEKEYKDHLRNENTLKI